MLHFIYIFFSTNMSSEYFKHAAHSPFFSSKCRLFRNATFFWFLCYSHFTYRVCWNLNVKFGCQKVKELWLCAYWLGYQEHCAEYHCLDMWLAVHHSITFLLLPSWYTNFLFIHTLHKIKFLYMFRAQSAHHQEVNDANCTYAASGIVTLCKWPSCATA